MYIDEEIIERMTQVDDTTYDKVVSAYDLVPKATERMFKRPEPKQPNSFQKLNSLRSDIEELDQQIIDLLDRRFALTKAVGVIKKQEGIPIENLEVESIKLRQVPEVLKSIFKLIYSESKKQQEAL
ncbi:hypothetical protein [Providencia phage PSTRCR_121]|nr:hypothetical protein [Providencia phage PSTRCR_121]